MNRFHIITAFPESFSYLDHSIPKRAVEKGLAEINIVDLRKFSDDKWNKIDDRPFGGGAGMVLKIEPIYKAIESTGIDPETKNRKETEKVLVTSPRGFLWKQAEAKEYVETKNDLVLICGHYEGIDQRVVEFLSDGEVSIGHFILSGGELAAMIIIDSITRLVSGVVGNEESVAKETEFSDGAVYSEHDHYTRPEIFTTDSGQELKVPDVLLSGHHGEIEKWREQKVD